MSTSNTTLTPKQVFPAVLTASLEDKIRRRAYELFLSRGAQHGRDLEDWLQAESELVRPTLVPPVPRATVERKPRKKR